MKSTLTVRIPADLRQSLDRYMKKEKIGISDLMRDSLRRYVAVSQFEAIRKRALKRAAKMGIFTDEDVFKIVS